MEQDFYIDLHCHPSIKPFSKAYDDNINDRDPKRNNSIWNNDPPTRGDIVLNKFLTVTRFSQSNFTALYRGNVKVVIVALNPLEKGFFTTRLGKGNFADRIYDFVTEIGKPKIDFIQRNNDYFTELRNEYRFYEQLDNVDIPINGHTSRYKLTSNYKNIKNHLNNPGVIYVVLSIEGGHVFNNDTSHPIDRRNLMANIDEVKTWHHPPFFITLSHHFYNELGGHARSLFGFKSCIVKQSHGLNDCITEIGKEAISHLLDNTNSRRIYIDIKHMSRKVRQYYYELLETSYRNEDIPIIVSHGAVNGYPSVNDDNCPNKSNHGLFWGRDINFYDDEIVKIALSHGIFGLQIDDRLITNKRVTRKINSSRCSTNCKLYMRAGLLWNQIQHIAEVLDSKGLEAWGTTAIGTDFDGMVDPPIGFWTWESLPKQLSGHLYAHAYNYLNGNNPLRLSNNRTISPSDILRNIFSGNAMKFLERYY